MAEIEIGITGNPIVFTGVIAGEEFQHPNNPFYLWNDKGGVSGSVDAKQITLSVLGLNIADELVGLSDGSPSQIFTVTYFPMVSGDSNNPVTIKVNGIIWTAVYTLVGASSSDEVYVLDYNTGVIQFGDNVNGKIPLISSTIEVTYTPDKTEFGTEVQEFKWLGVRSAGVISNAVPAYLERQISADEYHVIVSHVNIVAVTGVYLNTDSHRNGTNYYTGGTFNASTGYITLGTILPYTDTTVLVDYSYTILDDAEAVYTQIGGTTVHTFFHPIPRNNAKQISLRIVAPATASPSGPLNLRFRIRLDFRS